MRLFLLLFVALFFFHSNFFAQNLSGRYYYVYSYNVNPQYPAAYFSSAIRISWNSAYRFSSFLPGTIFFRNGDSAFRYFNYNIIRNEMHFIDERGDTITLTELESLKYINVNGVNFFYEKPYYLQAIETKKGLTLAMRQEIRAYTQTGIMPNASQKDDIRKVAADYFAEGSKFIKVDETKYVVISTVKTYYFGDGFGTFKKATKNHMLLFSEKRDPAVKKFVHNHHTDFTNLKDLRELLQFYNSIN